MMILNQFIKPKPILQCLKLVQQIHYVKKGTFTASPQTVFQVIKNTNKYSEFIPWCNKSSITNKISSTQNYTQLTIAFQKVKSLSYLSHVLISGQKQYDKNYHIQSTCKEQPLRSLVSIWQIQKDPIIEGDLQLSMVNYSIQYQFSSPILQLTSHFFLDYVGQSMWLIFKEQAEKRQREINSEKVIMREKRNLTQSHFTIGQSKNNQKSSSISSEISHQNKQNSGLSNNNNNIPATNLIQYLSKNNKIHQIYCTNSQFKNKLDKWSNLLNGTNDFEVKLEFKIKNYLIHKN